MHANTRYINSTRGTSSWLSSNQCSVKPLLFQSIRGILTTGAHQFHSLRSSKDGTAKAKVFYTSLIQVNVECDAEPRMKAIDHFAFSIPPLPLCNNYYVMVCRQNIISVYKNLVCRDYSKRIYACTHTHTGTRTHEHMDYTKQHTHNLEMGSKQRLQMKKEMDEHSSTE